MTGAQAKAALVELLERSIIYLDSPADCVRVSHIAMAEGHGPIVTGRAGGGRLYVRRLPAAPREPLYLFELGDTVYVSPLEEEAAERFEEETGARPAHLERIPADRLIDRIDGARLVFINRKSSEVRR